MKRRDVLATGSAALALGAAFAPRAIARSAGAAPEGAAPEGAAPAGADQRLSALLDRLFNEELALSPQALTALGLDKGANAAARSRLDEVGEAARAKGLAQARKGIALLEAVDPAALSPAGKRHRALALYRYRQAIAPNEQFGIDAVELPYSLSQQGGAYFTIPDFLDSTHPIETAADGEAYLARLHQFGAMLDGERADHRLYAEKGLIAPGWSLDLVLGQMRKLRDVAPEQSGMAGSLATRAAAKGIAGDWRARAAAIIAREVYPALDRQIALVEEWRRIAPAGDGIWRVPRGEAIYAAALREATTTSYTAADIHRIGLDQVAELTARLDAVLRAAGHSAGNVSERLTALNHAPEQLYPNTDAGRAELLTGLNDGIRRMYARLPEMFADVPGEKLEIRRVPPEIQDGASNGYYYSAALDGSRPGIYWINLKDTGDWPRYTLPTLTWHEGVPGHHLHGGYQRLDKTLPLMLQNWFISSYGEGWALYAEQLADEIGMNQGLQRAGFLQSLLFRAARLVVDTGIHAQRWSREQATDYMVNTTGFARPRAQREVERYCVMIGQACSYKMGHTVWVKTREKAKALLGPKFSLPWFHEILKEGVMPLDMLEARIDERIAERMRA